MPARARSGRPRFGQKYIRHSSASDAEIRNCMAADAFPETTSTIESAERREMTMALRVPMLVLLSGTLVGGVAATHIAPQLFSGVQQSTAAQSEAPALALATSAEAASGPQIADPQPVKEASSSAGCKEAAWP